MKGHIIWISDKKGIIKGEDNKEYYFHTSSIKQIKDQDNFSPKKNLKVGFKVNKNLVRGYYATNIKLPSISKNKIKTEKKKFFRSEVILNKILDIYMNSLHKQEASNGWGEYFVDYYFNPRGKYIMFNKISLRFVKSMKLKKEYKSRFNESCDYKVLPNSKTKIREELKKELLKRMKKYPNQYRLEEFYLNTFRKSVKYEFKLEDSEGVYISNLWSHALSEKEAEKRVFINVPSESKILGYRRVK